MKNTIPLVSALVLSLAMAGWAACGPYTGGSSSYTAGGCKNHVCVDDSFSATLDAACSAKDNDPCNVGTIHHDINHYALPMGQTSCNDDDGCGVSPLPQQLYDVDLNPSGCSG